LEIWEGGSFVLWSHGEECDKGIKGGVESINDVGNEILIINRFPNSSKLIGPGLNILQVFRTGLGALPESLKLVLQMWDMRLNGRGKFGCQRSPNFLRSLEAIDCRENRFTKMDIDPAQDILILFLPNGIGRI
jgi:hypothetical protein